MANIKTDIFALCDYATVSREQKLSIIGIFDQFFVAQVPASWPKMFLVAVLIGQENTEYNLKLKMTPPPISTGSAGSEEKAKFPDKDLKVTLGPNGKANLVTELVNFPLPAVGVYRVQILQEKEKVGELQFRVNKTTPTYQGQDLHGKKATN